jgi:anti-sigma factor RsiW
VSHLGRNLSALVDGELSPAARDRAHAHLVVCEQCRAEANALRELRKRMRGLPDAPVSDALTRRLMFIGEPGGPVPLRGHLGPLSRAVSFGGRPRHRRRYVALGAACMVAGLSGTAFSLGGSPSVPGPRVTPPVEMYSVEHAMTTGEILFSGPAAWPGPETTGSPQVP